MCVKCSAQGVTQVMATPEAMVGRSNIHIRSIGNIRKERLRGITSAVDDGGNA